MLIADVNEFHPLTDAAAYKAGRAPDGSAFDVVILRATYSTWHVDNAYVGSVGKARAAGLVVCHYGYLAASDDAAAAGRFFGETLKSNGWQSGEPIFCDDEEGSGDQSPRVIAFLAAAHAVLNDDTNDEGDYSGEAFAAAHLASLPAGVHSWRAAYGQAAVPPGAELWQYTDNRDVAGVSGPCDCSIFNGTLDQFVALFAAKAAPVTFKPVPAPTPAPKPVTPPAPPVRKPAQRNTFTPLAVDGDCGPATVRARQFVDFNGDASKCDGIDGPLSHRAMQAHLGVAVDGIVGPQTIRALQQHVLAIVDGRLGPETYRHLQAALNAGRY